MSTLALLYYSTELLMMTAALGVSYLFVWKSHSSCLSKVRTVWLPMLGKTETTTAHTWPLLHVSPCEPSTHRTGPIFMSLARGRHTRSSEGCQVDSVVLVSRTQPRMRRTTAEIACCKPQPRLQSGRGDALFCFYSDFTLLDFTEVRPPSLRSRNSSRQHVYHMQTAGAAWCKNLARAGCRKEDAWLVQAGELR